MAGTPNKVQSRLKMALPVFQSFWRLSDRVGATAHRSDQRRGERPATFARHREPNVIAFRRALGALRQSPLQHCAELIRMFARFERQRARHFEMLDVVMRRIRLRKDGSDAHVLDPRSVFLELTDRTLQCCNGFRRRLPPRRGSPYPIRGASTCGGLAQACRPVITDTSKAASATLRAMTPTVSRDSESGLTPWRLIAAKLGL
jgi:hypothetical protein